MGTAKGFGGDVTVTLTLADGKIIGCTAEGKDETEGVGSTAIDQLPGAIAESGSIAVDGVCRRNRHLQRHQGGCRCRPDRGRPEPRRLQDRCGQHRRARLRTPRWTPMWSSWARAVPA